MTFAWWHPLVALIPMLPSFWSIWHIWSHEFETPQQRALWLVLVESWYQKDKVLVVFLPVLGGIIYIFTGRTKARGKIQR